LSEPEKLENFNKKSSYLPDFTQKQPYVKPEPEENYDLKQSKFRRISHRQHHRLFFSANSVDAKTLKRTRKSQKTESRNYIKVA
tara:strand:+ start:238 stop:489 length:252 start_codon:yes stop_codon:yes gene_type:complete